jgi:hypothetical protein
VSVTATPDGQAARSRRTIEQVLAAARSRISRLTATQAADVGARVPSWWTFGLQRSEKPKVPCPGR